MYSDTCAVNSIILLSLLSFQLAEMKSVPIIKIFVLYKSISLWT